MFPGYNRLLIYSTYADYRISLLLLMHSRSFVCLCRCGFRFLKFMYNNMVCRLWVLSSGLGSGSLFYRVAQKVVVLSLFSFGKETFNDTSIDTKSIEMTHNRHKN
jgi:hypothetical protein